MKLECVIDIRSVYGKVMAYPWNEAATSLAAIAGAATLTKRKLEIIERTGIPVRDLHGRDWRAELAT